MIEQSDKMELIPLSPIRKIFDKVNELKKQGVDVISLGIGEPDFDTPQNICEAMIKATLGGKTHYTPNKGIPELRNAISQKLARDNDLHYGEEEIICTVGVSEGVYISISAFLNEGDEILIPDPAWLNYGHVANLNGGKIVRYNLKAINNFQIDIQELNSLVSNKTKAIVILNPSNPTGSVLSRETLEAVANFARENDLLVISDEIYEKIIYDNNKHISIASLPDMRERTIVLNGFAKSYAMTGWRLGYIAAPQELIPPMAKLHSYLTTSASTMVQYGGVEALQGPQDSLNAMVAEFQTRRDLVYSELSKINGIKCNKPEGAFYLFADVSGTGLNAEKFSEYLLTEARVAVIPGTVFGVSAVNEVRISYASSLETLREAVSRIRKACEKL